MQNHRILQVVKNAVILASVSFVTDIFTMVSLNLVIDIAKNNPSFMYNVNLVINHLVTIGCFDLLGKLL